MMVSVQLLVIQTLMRNPQDFAEKSSRTPANKHFRHDPTPKRMREYLLDSIIRRRRPVNRSISIWDDDEDDDDQQPRAGAVPWRRFQRTGSQPLRTSSQPARQRRQNGISTWGDFTPRDSAQDSSQGSNSTRNTKQQRKKKERDGYKVNVIELHNVPNPFVDNLTNMQRFTLSRFYKDATLSLL